MTTLFRIRSVILPLLCLLLAAQAEEPVPPISEATETAPPPTLLSKINGLFNIELPRLDPPGTFKLIFYPHIGDLIRRGYIRTDVGVRWALNDHFGIDSEVDTYANHGFRSTNSGYGFGEVHSGAKYVFKEWPKSEYQTSIDLDVSLPVGHPPVDMTDGLRHYTPNVAIQYRPPAHPRWTAFAGANVDLVSTSNVVGTPPINTPRDDSLSFTSGAIYDMGQVKWTLQGTYTTTAVISNTTQNFYSVRPSFLWYAPKRFTFNSKTQWIFGLGANATWGPDGFHLGTSGRVRAEITLRQVMNNIRNGPLRN